jgi:hypothetical protein
MSGDHHRHAVCPFTNKLSLCKDEGSEHSEHRDSWGPVVSVAIVVFLLYFIVNSDNGKLPFDY